MPVRGGWGLIAVGCRAVGGAARRFGVAGVGLGGRLGGLLQIGFHLGEAFLDFVAGGWGVSLVPSATLSVKRVMAGLGLLLSMPKASSMALATALTEGRSAPAEGGGADELAGGEGLVALFVGLGGGGDGGEEGDRGGEAKEGHRGGSGFDRGARLVGVWGGAKGARQKSWWAGVWVDPVGGRGMVGG